MQPVDQLVDLGRADRLVVRIDQRRVQGELPEPGQRGQDGDPVLVQIVQQLEDPLPLALQVGVVDLAVPRRQLDRSPPARSCPAGRRRPGPWSGAASPAGSAAADRPAPRRRPAARSAGRSRLRKASACGNSPGAVSDRIDHSSIRLFSIGVPVMANRLSASRLRIAAWVLLLVVLHHLRLVQDQPGPADGGVLLDLQPQQRVRGDHDVGRSVGSTHGGQRPAPPRRRLGDRRRPAAPG